MAKTIRTQNGNFIPWDAVRNMPRPTTNELLAEYHNGETVVLGIHQNNEQAVKYWEKYTELLNDVITDIEDFPPQL